MVDKCVDHLGIELPAPPAASHGDGTLDTVGAVVNLHHVGELGDAHLDRDGVAADAPGQTSPVVAFERNATAACTVGSRPIRSASKAADVQCEWINWDMWPRALMKSVAIVLSRCTSG